MIFLIGYRGTGKSTVARLLAEKLGWDWIDADALLEARQGRTVAQIFQEETETGFRNHEAELLAELCRLQKHVVATGGGVILRSSNRELLRQAGTVVWLSAEPATLWQRLQGDATTASRRPNLTVGGQAEVEQLLKLREPHYRSCSHVSVSTEGRTPEQVAKLILTLLPSKMV